MRLNLDHQRESNVRPGGKLESSRSRALTALIILFAGILITTGFAPQLRAQPIATADTTAISSNRFLFIVDMSSEMKRYSQDVFKQVSQIIISSADGQLHRGDTLGLWTFAGDVSSDLPLQVWNPDEREQIASHTTDFLKVQPFNGPSHFDRVLAVMLPIIKHSDIITVIIISDGKGKMKGTASDKEINDLWQKNVKETKGHSPITTVLQGRQGKLYQFTVNVLPWPVIIPSVPLPPPVAKKPPAAPPVKPAAGPSLILSGPQTPPAHVPVPAPLPVTQTAETNPQPAPPTPTPPLATIATPPLPPPGVPPPPPPTAPENQFVPPPRPTPTTPVEPLPPPLVLTIPGGSPPPPATNGASATTPVPAPVVQTPVTPPPAAPTKVLPPANPPVVATTEITGRPRILLIAGVILGIVGLILIILTVVRGRDPGPSLITRSMNDKDRG